MLYGVDIHPRYQSSIDLNRLKSQGYTYVMVKASEGTGIPHNSAMSATAFKARMLRWVRQAQGLGMIAGLYHWIKAGNAVAQAQLFYSIVKEAGGPKGLLIMLDCEDNATLNDIKVWLKSWHSLSGGHPVMLYTGKWWWEASGRGWDGYALTPYLWDSHYIADDKNNAQDDPAAIAQRVPADWYTPDYGGWPRCTFLQFTSKGDAGGLTNNVDLNAFPGTMEQLLALTTIGTPQPTEGDHDMWCKHGQQGDPNNVDDRVGQNIAALQGDLIDAGAKDLEDHGGADGEYGDWTAKAMVEVLGEDVAGDGKVYGWRQRRALQAWLRDLSAGDGLVKHTHDFDPAAGTSGPAVATE